jgi:hypothetical protein
LFSQSLIGPVLGSTILAVVPGGNEAEGTDGTLHALTSKYPYVSAVVENSISSHLCRYEHPLQVDTRTRVDVLMVAELSGDGLWFQ